MATRRCHIGCARRVCRARPARRCRAARPRCSSGSGCAAGRSRCAFRRRCCAPAPGLPHPAGHSCVLQGSCSARYSAMARVSHTAKSPSDQHRHLAGRADARPAFCESWSPHQTSQSAPSTSSNGMPACVSSTQGRIDQDGVILVADVELCAWRGLGVRWTGCWCVAWTVGRDSGQLGAASAMSPSRGPTVPSRALSDWAGR